MGILKDEVDKMTPLNPQTYLNAVEEFHRAFQYRYPTPTEPRFDKETVDLRIRLLREECHELRTAESNLEILDAFCDIQYVLSGAILALGLRRLFEKAFKDRAFSDVSIEMTIGWLESNLQSTEGDDPFVCAVDCCIIQNALFDRIREEGRSGVFDEAFAAVHENNMGKLWNEDELSAIKKGEFKVTPSGDFKVSNGKFIVQRPDGKILKPTRHKAVDLGRFVNARP